jgi:hypothetical protein
MANHRFPSSSQNKTSRPFNYLIRFFAVLALLSGFRYSKYINIALLNAPSPDDDRWEEVLVRPRVTTHYRNTTNKVLDTDGPASNPTHVGKTVSTTSVLTFPKIKKKPSNQTQTGFIQQHQTDQNRRYENITFSFCLLIKDDNEILNEWIAYHYHTINLRHLIVAVDPSSSTSPSSILEEWRQVFGLQVEEWTDHDYMPQFFLRKKYRQIPVDFLQLKNRTDNLWTVGVTNRKVMERKLRTINNHRFRQVVFLQKCVESLRKRHEEQGLVTPTPVLSSNNNHHNRSSSSSSSPPSHPHPPETTTTTPSSSAAAWMAHIDTDEFIVINPRIRAQNSKFVQSILPAGPHASSILHFLEDFLVQNPEHVNRTCIAMGMVRFGAREDDIDIKNSNPSTTTIATTTTTTTTTTRSQQGGRSWNQSHFETLRWKYYGASNATVNQKTVMDLATIPPDDKLLWHTTLMVDSIHQPSLQLCPPFPFHKRELILDSIAQYPLALNHYLGSYQRYKSRTDLRRNEGLYRVLTNLSLGGGKDDDWLAGWLDSFVRTHGPERVSRVLKDYLL